MFWVDQVVKEIIKSGKYKPFWVDDMKTPSGYLHMGSLRGPLLHDFIYKGLLDASEKAKFTYIFNDFDPIDGLSEDLIEKGFEKYLGLPLKNAPSPGEGADNFADFFANDLKDTLTKLGVEPEYLSSWDMYHQGKFNEAIKLALDNAQTIQEIYHEVSGSKKKEQGWLPLQVICQNCGKLGTTRVYDWDGKEVSYKCEEEMVKWAKGCGLEGKISPFDGNGKLPWKVDWPAHWMVLGVTIEGAGKDHSVKGGTRHIAQELCEKVFKIQEPYNLAYDFITIGGKKMASSKGLGLKAHDLLNILPPEVGRFFYCRFDYRQEINFDPQGTMAIPDLFDEYDRCYQAYIESSDENFSRAFELAQVGELPPKEKTFIPRFRDVVNYIQQATDLVKKFEEVKGSSLNEIELALLKEREKYAKIWIEKYAPEEFRMGMSSELPESVKNLSDHQKKYLKTVIELLEESTDAEKLQLDLYNLSKEQGISSKEAFGAIYQAMIGKSFGPKAGAFLLQYPKEQVIQRLKEAAEK